MDAKEKETKGPKLLFNFKVLKFILWTWLIVFATLGLLFLLYPTFKRWDDEFVKTHELFVAIAKGSDKDVAAYIEKGDDINIRSVLGLTPLHFAAALGMIPSVKRLLNATADPQLALQKKVWYGASTVYISALFQQTKVINLLAYRKYELNHRGWYGETALQWSLTSELSAGRLETMKALVNAGCDPKIGNWLAQTPLHFATRSGLYEEAYYLMKQLYVKNTMSVPKNTHSNSNSNIEDAQGASEIVGIDSPIDATDWLGYSALHLAASAGHYNIAARLISVGKANVNSRSWYLGMTPLHEACLNGHVEIAHLLLTNGADIYVLNWQRIMPLDEGAECKINAKIITWLENRMESSRTGATRTSTSPAVDTEL